MQVEPDVVAKPSAKAPTKLLNKNFVLLWQGQLVSQIGSQAFHIAMVFWIKQATGSASLMGLLLMASALPAVLLGPIAGTFADRHSRRNILIFCDTFSGLSVLSLAGLMFWMPQATDLILVWIFVVSVLVAIFNAFFRPAQSAAIPDLVPAAKLNTANSLNQSSFQISNLFGQGLGGVLFRILGAPLLFLVDGISYLFSALSECFIKIPQTLPDKKARWREMFQEFKRDTVVGMRYMWRHPGMRNFFFAISVLNFFSYPFIVLMPFYVEDYLKVTPDWYGYLLAAWGLGALLGNLITGAVNVSGRLRSWLIIIFLTLASLLLGALGILFIKEAVLALFLVVGMMSGFINVSIVTILQQSTPSDIRGRVFGLLTTIAAGLAPVSMGLTGVIADLLNQNVPLIYLATAIIGTLLTVLIALNKDFREFLAYEPDQDAS